MSVNLQTSLFRLSFHCSWFLSVSLIQFYLFLVRECIYFYLRLELNLIISELLPFVSCPSLVSLCTSLALSCSTILWVTYVSSGKNLCSWYLSVWEYYGPHINPGYSFYLTYLKFDFFPPVEILIFSCHSFTSDHCCSVLCYQQMCTEDSNILDVHHWMCTGPKGRDCCFGKCCFFGHWFSYAKLQLQYLLLCYQSTWSQELCTLFWGPCDLSKPYLLQFSCLCVFKHARKDGLRLQLAILL